MTDTFAEIATVRIELRGTNPPIWRQVEVPTSITLKVLHDVVQVAMSWFDCHLWEFTIAGQRYGLPMGQDWGMEPSRDPAKVRLRDVLRPRRTIIDYLYDFGDGWEHRLTVTNVRQGEPGIGYPRYVAGERNAPPEDCGGIPGFYEQLGILADPIIRITRRLPTGSTTTTPRRSTNSLSRSRLAASPSAGTPSLRAWRRRNPIPATDAAAGPNSTRPGTTLLIRGCHRTLTAHRHRVKSPTSIDTDPQQIEETLASGRRRRLGDLLAGDLFEAVFSKP